MALEIFWEDPSFTNMSVSFHTFNNYLIPYKLISSGSNFDIVFYKAFMSYYLDTINPTKETDSKKTFKARNLTIRSKIAAAISKKGCDSNFSLEYVEFTTGFYMVIGKVEARIKPIPPILLKVSSKFQNSKYIISPEFLNILEGKIVGLKSIKISASSPLFFILIRTDITSRYSKVPDLKIDDFFSSFEIKEMTNKDKEDTKKNKEIMLEI